MRRQFWRKLSHQCIQLRIGMRTRHCVKRRKHFVHQRAGCFQCFDCIGECRRLWVMGDCIYIHQIILHGDFQGGCKICSCDFCKWGNLKRSVPNLQQWVCHNARLSVRYACPEQMGQSVRFFNLIWRVSPKWAS